MVDLDTYREQSLATWNKMTSGWEARHDWLIEMTGLVNDWIIRHADPQPGQTILDIAAGPGDLGHDLSERVGADGRVISTDFSPQMVELARRLGDARGVSNIEYRVLNAEKMDLGDDAVDGAVCRFGYMLMADPGQALKETRRVLKDGGTLGFAVWRGPEHNPWFALPGMTIVQRGVVPPPEPGAPGIGALADPDRIRELLSAAGFSEPELEEISFHFHYADEGDVWDALIRLAGALSQAVQALPEDEQQAIRAAVIENVAGFKQEDGSYTMPAACWGVIAR
jgi:SAM-dependent methyltransferase